MAPFLPGKLNFTEIEMWSDEIFIHFTDSRFGNFCVGFFFGFFALISDFDFRRQITTKKNWTVDVEKSYNIFTANHLTLAVRNEKLRIDTVNSADW